MATDINIGAFLGTRAFLNPNKEALYDVAKNRRLTFTDLNDRANQACAALRGLGLSKGDRVAVLTYNGNEFGMVVPKRLSSMLISHPWWNSSNPWVIRAR